MESLTSNPELENSLGSTRAQRRHRQDGPHPWVKRTEKIKKRKPPLEGRRSRVERTNFRVPWRSQSSPIPDLESRSYLVSSGNP